MGAQQFYHITPDGPRPCRATLRSCKYGSAEHHRSMDEAQKVYEGQLVAKYGASSTLGVTGEDLTTAREKFRHSFYKKIDEHPNAKGLHKTLKILGITGRGAAKTAVAATGAVILTTMVTTRVLDSVIRRKPLDSRRKLNARKLLLTKYWVPDLSIAPA